MTPKHVTPEGEREEHMRALCDTIIYRAARMMVESVKAPLPMVLDRLLTFAGAQACSNEGPSEAARLFRQLADGIEAGAFDEINRSQGRRKQ